MGRLSPYWKDCVTGAWTGKWKLKHNFVFFSLCRQNILSDNISCWKRMWENVFAVIRTTVLYSGLGKQLGAYN